MCEVVGQHRPNFISGWVFVATHAQDWESGGSGSERARAQRERLDGKSSMISYREHDNFRAASGLYSTLCAVNYDGHRPGDV